jgi:hypothetical protein
MRLHYPFFDGSCMYVIFCNSRHPGPEQRGEIPPSSDLQGKIAAAQAVIERAKDKTPRELADRVNYQRLCLLCVGSGGVEVTIPLIYIDANCTRELNEKQSKPPLKLAF